jgi:ParB-like chromosome segregation protein Spo0J
MTATKTVLSEASLNSTAMATDSDGSVAKFAVELWPIEKVQPYDRNPRVNDDAVDAVATSLAEFGFRQPIVVDGDGVIIVGHTRWKAAKKLGLARVPVHIATDLSADQVRAYRIADNQTATLAEWDFELLPIELKDLQQAEYDLSVLGFDAEELAELLDGDVAEGLTDPDAVPEPPDAAITQRGDIWVLGDHRLMCGDSSSAADLDRLLDKNEVHLLNTDPPYNVRLMYRAAA